MIIYEINTAAWLAELGGGVTLATLPDSVYEKLFALSVDAIWLMGVWQRSNESIAINRASPLFSETAQAILPDFSFDQDVIGSAYSIAGYQVDVRWGGPEGLAAFRARLHERGIKLILDYVPNHVAIDHPWVKEHPNYFVQGTAADQKANPDAYRELDGQFFALARDPHYAPWSDVLQLNASSLELRGAAQAQVQEIASQCDGVRCDMAMLLMNRIFTKTWPHAGTPPPDEYWTTLIQSVKQAHPDFVFIAEAYWNTEPELLGQGFDFCYDKPLYDALVTRKGQALRQRLQNTAAYQEKLIRFLENHDELRAATAFGAAVPGVAALFATLPGAKLYYDGQLWGAKVRVPVQLTRGPRESGDPEVLAWYEKTWVVQKRLQQGGFQWSLLQPACLSSLWHRLMPSTSPLVAWIWTSGSERVVTIANLSGKSAEAKVSLPGGAVQGNVLDVLSSTQWQTRGATLSGALEPWQTVVFDLPA